MTYQGVIQSFQLTVDPLIDAAFAVLTMLEEHPHYIVDFRSTVMMNYVESRMTVRIVVILEVKHGRHFARQ